MYFYLKTLSLSQVMRCSSSDINILITGVVIPPGNELNLAPSQFGDVQVIPKQINSGIFTFKW